MRPGTHVPENWDEVRGLRLIRVSCTILDQVNDYMYMTSDEEGVI